MAIAGLIALIVILIKNFDKIADVFRSIGDGIMWVYENLIKPVFDAILWVVDMIVGALQWLWDMIKGVADFFADTFGWIADTVGAVGGFLGDIGGAIGGVFGFQEGGIVTEPTLGLLGEAGAEAVIPLKRGAVPVTVEGDFGGGGDKIDIHIHAGELPHEETPESLTQKVADGLREAKMRGTNAQV